MPKPESPIDRTNQDLMAERLAMGARARRRADLMRQIDKMEAGWGSIDTEGDDVEIFRIAQIKAPIAVDADTPDHFPRQVEVIISRDTLDGQQRRDYVLLPTSELEMVRYLLTVILPARLENWPITNELIEALRVVLGHSPAAKAVIAALDPA